MTIIFDGTNGITSPGGDTANTSYTSPILKSASALTFQTNGSTTALTIDTSQNVGIGTTSPVFGVGSGVELYRVGTATYRLSSSGAGVEFRNNSGTGELEVRGAFPLVFGTNATERMRIDSAGQVGVGVTPNTWSTGRVVEVGVSGTSLWGLSSGTSYVTAGYYFNSTDKFALTGNYAIFSQLVPSDGSFRWRASTATGTAGNNATMETNLTLTQGGTLVLKNGDTAATGIGITFPATQSASSNANTLDDYEEGTFTPTIVYSGTNTPAYSYQLGRYTKIGRIVQMQIFFAWNENGSTGNVTVGGLPFTAVTSFARAIPTVLSTGLTGLPANISITGQVESNTTTINLFLNDNVGTVLSATYTDNDQDLYLTVTYQTT